jgi:hypothetical protein
MRWAASDEASWVADLDSAAAAVWKLRDAELLEEGELRDLLDDLWVLLNVTAGRLEAALQERRWLRAQVRP